MGKDSVGEFEELVLLAILKLGNKTYGVPLRDALEEATGRAISIGALYATLSRLEDKGFIKSWMGEPTAERGGRAKKFFRVAARGERAVHEANATRRKLAVKPARRKSPQPGFSYGGAS